MIEKRHENETKGKFSNASKKNYINLKYEAISVPQGSVRLVKKTQERKSPTCYLLITKGFTSLSPVPQKTRRVGKFSVLELTQVHTSRVDTAFLVNTVATDERLRNSEPRISDEDDS
ncbi:hypothetical protein TNCV_4862361 [Trichonephila clavipes]|nr:hypothetical protein TNCV_4862361 [Trichonephila clavipes]